MKQSGVSDTSLLLVFVFFIILAVIAIPKYLEWSDRDKNTLTSELRRIHKAQTTYIEVISPKRNFGSFKDLIFVKQLPDNCPNCDGNTWTARAGAYRFEMVRNYEETRYCVKASGDNKTLAMDSSGRIFESETNKIGCAMGEVKGDLFSEVK